MVWGGLAGPDLSPPPSAAEAAAAHPLGQKLLDEADLASSHSQVALKLPFFWGPWMAQSVERLTSAQVTMLQFVGSSPASNSVLTAQSLEPAFGFCVSLSLCSSPTHMLCLSVSLSLSLSKINIKKIITIKIPFFSWKQCCWPREVSAASQWTVRD